MKCIIILIALQLAFSSARPSDITFEDDNSNRTDDSVEFPYYGGLKGYSLRVPKDVFENKSADNSFEVNLSKIQEAAAHLVEIQEIAKKKGSFSESENKIYAKSLYDLGVAAQNLAQLQQDDDGSLYQLFQGQLRPSSNRQTTTLKPSTDDPNQDTFTAVSQNDPYEDYVDSVSVNAPRKDASVAEAKPVGLSIAGPGGVASSKPNGVAIAGREGLAVASPKGTAIAGVSPEEAAAFSVNIPGRNNIIIKKRIGSTASALAVDDIKSLRNKNLPDLKIRFGLIENEDEFDPVEGLGKNLQTDDQQKGGRQSFAVRLDEVSLPDTVYGPPFKAENKFGS